MSFKKVSASVVAVLVCMVPLVTSCGSSDDAAPDIPSRGLYEQAAKKIPEETTPLPKSSIATIVAGIDSYLTGFNDKHEDSETGAKGRGSFIPVLWDRFQIDGNNDGNYDPFNPEDSIPTSMNFVSYIIGTLNNADVEISVKNIAASYWKGTKIVIDKGGADEALSDDPEGKEFVDSVNKFYEEHKQ